MKLHFGHLLGLSALAIAGCAAFFSVYGISQLFAGAFVAVVIMASALEFGKLIAASYLQRYWKKIATGMKIYVVTGVIVLVGVTSAGIYGFLSNAYQQTSNALGVNDAKVKNITLKKNRYDEELDAYTLERSQLSTTVNELSKGLANNVIQYKDRETGEIITTTSSSTRRALEAQLSDAKGQRDKITPKMDVLRDSVTSMELQILDLNVNNEAGAELGPLIYISELLDISMDRVVNYFILLLIFVFDPLAIALVLATNKVFEDKRIEKEEKEKSDAIAERFKNGPPEGFKPLDLNLQSNVQDLIDAQEFVKDKGKEYGGIPEKYFGYADVIKEVEKEEPELESQPFIDKYGNTPPDEYKQYDLFEITTLSDAVNDDDIQQASEVLMEDLMEEEPALEEIYDEDAEPINSLEEAQKLVEERYPELPKIEVLTERPVDVVEPKPVDVVQPIVVRPPIPQPERPVAKNGIVKPVGNIGRTAITADEPIRREDIKEIKEGASRGFIKKIPRRRGNI